MSEDQGLQAALDAMWRDMRPTVRARVATVVAAVDALAAGDADPELVERGRADAHKLAGLLGTVGRPRGSALARELEEALESASAPARAQPSALAAVARALHDEVERG